MELVVKAAKSIATFEYEMTISKYKKPQPMSLKRNCLQVLVHSVNNMKRCDDHAGYERLLECYGHIDMAGICMTYYTKPPGLIIYRSHASTSRLIQDLRDPKTGLIQLMPQTCVPNRNWPCTERTVNGNLDDMMDWYRVRHTFLFYKDECLDQLLQLDRRRFAFLTLCFMCSFCGYVHTPEGYCLDLDIEIRLDSDVPIEDIRIRPTYRITEL